LRNQELKKAGLKVTAPRIKILHMFENSANHHLSAEDIYKNLLQVGEEIGLATVYRVLTQFEEAGLVTRHNFESGHSIFELNQGCPHDHMVCIKCGKVEEFADKSIADRLQKVAADAKFRISDHSLNIYGVCAKCEKK